MEQNSGKPKSRRRKWIWILAAVVFLLVAAGVFLFATNRFQLWAASLMDTEKPQIILVESGMPIAEGVPYEEEGFTATDNCDGDITHLVERRELYGKVVYTVADRAGNVTTVERHLPNYDPLPPTILLEGEEAMELCFGRPYQEPGYLCLDNVDGDLTELVETEGEVDSFTAGVYTVTYRAMDASQNQIEVQRTVEVVPQPRVEEKLPEGKVIYLTFDDGPGPYTEKLLDLLDQYGVKATFFVTDTEYSHLLKEIVDRGHAIGIHTVDHEYTKIYRSQANYFEDLLTMQQLIREATGVTTTLMRFPGGSSNLVSLYMKRGIMTRLIQSVQDGGFQYFDWNVDSKDAGIDIAQGQVITNVIRGIQQQPVSIVLMHDTRDYSVNAVEDIIKRSLEMGYTFLPLQPDSPGFHHAVRN